MPITRTKVKKDGLQQYRVRVNYTDRDGVHRQVERTAYGKAEAQDMERRLLAECTAAPQPKANTVADLYAKYADFRRHEVRESTLEKSNRTLELHVLPLLGSCPLQRLDTPKLLEWKAAISDKGLVTTTKNSIYKEFRALLNFAVRLRWLPSNPLLEAGPFRDPYFEMQEEKLHYYTADQFLRYHAALREAASTMTQWGTYTFFALAFYTGMRKGEIHALRWSDISPDGVISVRRSISQKIKGKPITETPPKNKASYRRLQAPLPLLRILDEQRTRQQADPRWTEDYRVCGGPGVISDTTIENANKRAAIAADLPHIRVHDFRHTHASLLINEAISIQEVARRLGHADVKMTWGTYGHLYPREEERALVVLNKITPEEIPEKSPNEIQSETSENKKARKNA